MSALEVARGTFDGIVRRASTADVEPLACFAYRLFVERYANSHPEPTLSRHASRTFSAGVFARAAAAADSSVFVAFDARQSMAGYALSTVGAPPDEATDEVTGHRFVELVKLYVDPPWHGRGVAQLLMDAVVDDARSRSAGTLWVQAWSLAPQALAFYRKSGFRDFGTAKFHMEDRIDDDILLRLPL